MNTLTICLIIWASDKLIRLGLCQDVNKEYIGCYEDGSTDDKKIFTEFGKYLPHWNPMECRQECLSHNLFYYGISQKCMCFCGNSSSNYTQYGSRPEGECNNRCTSSLKRIKVFEVQCPLLQLENGDVRVSHTTAKFTCNSGFELSGQEEINCVYRNDVIRWDEQPSRCVIVSPTVSIIAPTINITFTEIASTSDEHLSQSNQTTAHSNRNNETLAMTTLKSQNTQLLTPEPGVSHIPTEYSSQDSWNQSTLSTFISSVSSNIATDIFLDQETDLTSHDNDIDGKKSIVQLLLHLLIAVLPVIIILFFILLSCCCSFDDRKHRRRRTLGDSTCGPSSFEFMTPRVIKRQFSASTLPMSYNRSFGLYNSKDNLDYEIDTDEGLETEYEDENVYFDLTADSNVNHNEGITYV